LSPLITGGFERVIVPQLNEVRRAEGLAPLRDMTDIIARAPLTLSMTAEPFEYPRSDWPDSVVMVGPCTWEPPVATPPWLAESSEPIVLVTTSSEFQDDDRLVRAALEGLAGERLRVVATVPAGDPAAFDVPPNARVERFLPHGMLLERAVCAVTHGGMGATQKALVRGVPVCAVPFGRDQFEVARRVEVVGAGSRLPARRLTPDRLRTKVHEAMGCAEGARRVATGFEAAGGPIASADAIELTAIGPATVR
jgi:MGT family glycosyltransferase